MRIAPTLIAGIVIGLAATARGGVLETVPGDCNDSRGVEISDVIAGINLAMGFGTLASCPSIDLDADGAVRVNDITALVVLALQEPTVGADCGDFILDADEQCDDGNGDGTACDSGCRLIGTGVLDQAWRGVQDPHCGGSSGRNNIGSLGPFFQEFVPTLPALTDVSITIGSSVDEHHDRSGTLRLAVHVGTPSGAVIASSEARVTPPADANIWHRVAFGAPIPVVPGERYVIEVSSPDTTLMLAQAESGCAPHGYAPGSAVGADGTPFSADWLFATFGTVEGN
jgi:hypothetical protein